MIRDWPVPFPPWWNWCSLRRARFGGRVAGLGMAKLVLLLAAMLVAFAMPASARDDDFYEVSPQEVAGPPGSLLRLQGRPDITVTRSFVWRIVYRSVSFTGEPIAVSATVLIPFGAPPAGGWPVIAWAHGTTGIVPKCGPSELDDPLLRIAGINQAITGRYVIVATDYPGLGVGPAHPYLVGVSEGRAILDSIRAVQAMSEAHAGSRTALFGFSQGGHAVLWANQIAPSYAPELDLVGVAALAPPTYLGELFTDDYHNLSGRILTGLVLEVMVGTACLRHPDRHHGMAERVCAVPQDRRRLHRPRARRDQRSRRESPDPGQFSEVQSRNHSALERLHVGEHSVAGKECHAVLHRAGHRRHHRRPAGHLQVRAADVRSGDACSPREVSRQDAHQASQGRAGASDGVDRRPLRRSSGPRYLLTTSGNLRAYRYIHRLERRSFIGPAAICYWRHGLGRPTMHLDLETRRRRLRFRAWHRGIRETDLIMGRFADANVDSFSVEEMEDFEQLLNIPDHDILAWVTGAAPVPDGDLTPVLARILAFHGTL